MTPTVVHHLDTCLGCRACEPACPSAGPYGELLTQTRDHIERVYERPAEERRARRTLLDTLTNPRRLVAALASANLLGRLPGGAAVKERVTHFLFGENAPQMPLPDRLYPERPAAFRRGFRRAVSRAAAWRCYRAA